MTEYIAREDALNFELEIESYPNEIQAITKGMALYAEHIKDVPAQRVIAVEDFENDMRRKHCRNCNDCNGLKCELCWVNDMFKEIDKAIENVEHSFTRRCYMCGASLSWESEAGFDEAGAEGDGIVSYYRCESCGAWYEIWVPHEREGEE